MAAGKLKLDIDAGKALASITKLEGLFKKLDASLNRLNTTLTIFSTVLQKNNKGIANLSRGYTQFGRTLSNVKKEFTAATRVAQRHNQKLQETRAKMASLMTATDTQTTSQTKNTIAKTRATAAQSTLTQTMERARTAVLAYVAALATGRLISFADATQRIDNRIKLALKPGQRFADLFAKVGKTAMGSRQPLEATATAFFRISQASKSLGISQDAALKATDLFNKLLTVQGVTSHEARSALLQYSQALQSGRFQGDEFRAISEILPQILDYLAAATGRTTAELRDLARQGQITPRVMLQALFDNAQDIEKQFARTNVTLTQGFNILTTSAHMTFSSIVKDALVLEAIGNTFKALHVILVGFLHAVGAALKVVGAITHFFNEILAITIIHFRTLIATQIVAMFNKLAVAIGLVTAAQVSLNQAFKANPLVILITTIVLVTIALRKYVVQIYEYIFAQEEANEETEKFNAMLTLLGDLLEAAGTEYGKWSKNLQQGAVAIGTALAQQVLKGIDDISAALARAIVAGESFKQSFLNITNLVKIAIVEALVQTVVQVAITALFSFIAKTAQAILDLRKDTVSPEMKIAIENAKQAKSLRDQLKSMKKLKELQKEEGTDPLKGGPLEQLRNKKTPEGFNPFGALGGGSGGIGTSLTTGALMSVGVPPVLSQSLAEPINKLGQDLLGGLNMNKMGIVNKLMGLESVTENLGLKQISTLTGGFNSLGNLLGGDFPGSDIISGAISGAKKVGKKLKFFANGGRPSMGMPSIVGEEGPELFVPDTPGTIVPNGAMGSTIVIQKLEILPYANVDEALTSKPMNFWVGLTQEKILPALNTLGQAGNTTTLKLRESR
jgi:tape measure domain-containing protein